MELGVPSSILVCSPLTFVNLKKRLSKTTLLSILFKELFKRVMVPYRKTTNENKYNAW